MRQRKKNPEKTLSGFIGISLVDYIYFNRAVLSLCGGGNAEGFVDHGAACGAECQFESGVSALQAWRSHDSGGICNSAAGAEVAYYGRGRDTYVFWVVARQRGSDVIKRHVAAIVYFEQNAGFFSGIEALVAVAVDETYVFYAQSLYSFRLGSGLPAALPVLFVSVALAFISVTVVSVVLFFRFSCCACCRVAYNAAYEHSYGCAGVASAGAAHEAAYAGAEHAAYACACHCSGQLPVGAAVQEGYCRTRRNNYRFSFHSVWILCVVKNAVVLILQANIVKGECRTK